eukprot:TRINITY_DN41137_c0_g1_i3.p1 TRINITY_DN41137_c0_g1~~TRINITY_DN41137_c0_g1_i3.p1  ORF type:complete len:307 (-),score=25.46 TRINITY_DN41137_c0_g1_i3:30-950(-)
MDSLKRPRSEEDHLVDDGSSGPQAQRTRSRAEGCDPVRYVRVSGAATKQLNRLYKLRQRRPAQGSSDSEGSGSDAPFPSAEDEESAVHRRPVYVDTTGAMYRIFKSDTDKWWIGTVRGYGEEPYADGGRAHSAVNPDGQDPVSASAWREFVRDGWQPSGLVVHSVTEELITVTVVSVAGVDLLCKEFSPVSLVDDVIDALETEGAVGHDRHLRVDLCFEGEVLKRRASLGGLPCEGGVTLQAVVKQRKKAPAGKCIDCRRLVAISKMHCCVHCGGLACSCCATLAPTVARDLNRERWLCCTCSFLL